MREEKVLRTAVFDERLPAYWMAQTLLLMACSVLGLVVVPFWLLLGMRVHRRQYRALECQLTERSLNIRRGFLFRVERNIPLDKIQDLGLKEGPILRSLGLTALSVETAGQSSPQGASDATLVGIVDSIAFRDAVLDQRDRVVAGPSAAPRAGAAAAPADAAGEQELLTEIRDGLLRIEERLRRRDERT